MSNFKNKSMNSSIINFIVRGVLFSSILLLTFQNSNAYAENHQELEIKVKAAYLYNFLRFVEWPDDHQAESNICVYGIGENYRSAFSSMASLSKQSQKINIDVFTTDDEVKNLSSCQIIFITDKAKHKLKAVFDYTKNKPALTVGESDDFIKKGGMINFIRVNDKIRFEINQAATKSADLKISSKVLRIAERVIKDEKTL